MVEISVQFLGEKHQSRGCSPLVLFLTWLPSFPFKRCLINVDMKSEDLDFCIPLSSILMTLDMPFTTLAFSVLVHRMGSEISGVWSPSYLLL